MDTADTIVNLLGSKAMRASRAEQGRVDPLGYDAFRSAAAGVPSTPRKTRAKKGKTTEANLLGSKAMRASRAEQD